jgi:SNF2-related domain
VIVLLPSKQAVPSARYSLSRLWTFNADCRVAAALFGADTLARHAGCRVQSMWSIYTMHSGGILADDLVRPNIMSYACCSQPCSNCLNIQLEYVSARKHIAAGQTARSATGEAGEGRGQDRVLAVARGAAARVADLKVGVLSQGLGKTLTCAAFLAGMLARGTIRRALIIAPKTLIAHWAKELKMVGLGRHTIEYSGTANQRRDALGRAHARPTIMLTTYGMVLHNEEDLARCALMQKGPSTAASSAGCHTCVRLIVVIRAPPRSYQRQC